MILPRHFLYIFLLLLIIVSPNLIKADGFSVSDNEPTIIIHDTIVTPGELLLQIDALNFVDDNGMVAAITLRIEMDTNLIEFISIQNTSISGSWLANYNEIENEISIIYTAPYPTGYDINGKLLDLRINYFGGFADSLLLKNNCEISNNYLQEIQDVIYLDGAITQSSALGTISQDTVIGWFNQNIQMPIIAEGDAYDMVNQIALRLGYDTTQLTYIGYEQSALNDINIVNNNAVLTIDWEDNDNPLDFTLADTLVILNFEFVGDTNIETVLLPGSKIYNNNAIVASEFINGYVWAKLLVEALNRPDTAGTALGGGYYFPEDIVTLTAIPEEGFHFVNWTQDTNIVSVDSIYIFEKAYSNDTLIANYQGNINNLTLISLPIDGGSVVGAGDYPFGESVSATAIAELGYYFKHWLNGVDTVSINLVYNFVMPDNDVTLTAVFGIYTYIITTEPNNINYGTTEGGGEFYYGDTATLIAIPYENYKFIVWTENGEVVSYDSVYEFSVISNRDLIANFQIDIECPSPIGLFVDDLAETSAVLNWVPAGEEQEWDLIWGITGFDTIDDGNLITDLSETNYLLENLNAGTDYDFYVRAICTDELNSAWSMPFTFSTWFVGVSTPDIKDEIIVFPNPAKNELKLIIKNEYSSDIKYRVVNSLGVLQLENKLTQADNYIINLNEISSGMYILQVFVDNNMFTKVFFKE